MMFENSQHCLTHRKFIINGICFLILRDGCIISNKENLHTHTVFFKILNLKNIPGRETVLNI